MSLRGNKKDDGTEEDERCAEYHGAAALNGRLVADSSELTEDEAEAFDKEAEAHEGEAGADPGKERAFGGEEGSPLIGGGFMEGFGDVAHVLRVNRGIMSFGGRAVLIAELAAGCRS